MENNELKHYGVPGMKWGVKRSRPRHSDSAHLKSIRKKRIKEMSNQDLRDANQRLQLEGQYRSLSRNASAGKRAVTAFIKTSGTITAFAAAVKVYKKIGDGALDAVCNGIVKRLGKIQIPH